MNQEQSKPLNTLEIADLVSMRDVLVKLYENSNENWVNNDPRCLRPYVSWVSKTHDQDSTERWCGILEFGEDTLDLLIKNRLIVAAPTHYFPHRLELSAVGQAVAMRLKPTGYPVSSTGQIAYEAWDVHACAGTARGKAAMDCEHRFSFRCDRCGNIAAVPGGMLGRMPENTGFVCEWCSADLGGANVPPAGGALAGLDAAAPEVVFF